MQTLLLNRLPVRRQATDSSFSLTHSLQAPDFYLLLSLLSPYYSSNRFRDSLFISRLGKFAEESCHPPPASCHFPSHDAALADQLGLSSSLLLLVCGS